MKLNLYKIVFILFLALAGNSTHAQWKIGWQPTEANIQQMLEQRLQERFGSDVHVAHFRKTPYLGLYEFRIGNQMGYTDEKISYIFIGSVLDGKNLNNLTEARLNELNRIPFEQLPLPLALKIVRGNGKRKLAIFEDPNCGYCKLFQKEIRNLSNITIYSFIYPILGQDSVVKAHQILCSANPQTGWQEWMLYGRMPGSKGDCKTSIEQVVKFGEQNNITSTPTIFFANGERVSGAIEIEKVEQIFKTIEK